jgi:hypothetical protein
MTTPLDLLVEARALIAERKNWISGAYAQNEHGREVNPRSEQACKFCSLGAIQRAYANRNIVDPSVGLFVDYEARHALEKVVGSIALFNDKHGHPQVLAAWDKAIESLRLEQNANDS